MPDDKHTPPEPPKNAPVTQPTQAPGSEPSKGPEPDKELKHAQTMIVVGAVIAFASIVMLSMLFAIIGAAVTAVGFRRLKALDADGRVDKESARRMRRLAYWGFGMSVFAFVVSAVVIALIYPTLLEVMQSGTYESLLSGTVDATSSTSSTWG